MTDKLNESTRPVPVSTLIKWKEALDIGGFHATARGNFPDVLAITDAIVKLDEIISVEKEYSGNTLPPKECCCK